MPRSRWTASPVAVEAWLLLVLSYGDTPRTSPVFVRQSEGEPPTPFAPWRPSIAMRRRSEMDFASRRAFPSGEMHELSVGQHGASQVKRSTYRTPRCPGCTRVHSVLVRWPLFRPAGPKGSLTSRPRLFPRRCPHANWFAVVEARKQGNVSTRISVSPLRIRCSGDGGTRRRCRTRDSGPVVRPELDSSKRCGCYSMSSLGRGIKRDL